MKQDNFMMIMRVYFLVTLLHINFCLNAQVYGSYKDTHDGRVYKTVKIGKQLWMAENLNVDRFRNGDLIPQAKTEEEWIKAGENKKPAWCYYENNTVIGAKYGKLYNWYAVSDSRGLAPEGWRISKSDDFKSLYSFLGMMGFVDDFSSEKDKELQLKCKNEWNKITYIHHVAKVPPAINKITNSTGWSAMPGGVRTFNGYFMGKGFLAFWYLENDEYPYQMGDFEGEIDVPNAGCSVRCIKE